MFDDTNGYGAIPDALPSNYGYADRQAPTVHQNMPTATSSNPFDQMGANQMVAANPAQPSLQPSYGGMQTGPVQGRNPHAPAPQPRPQTAQRPDLGAAQGKRIRSNIPVQTDEARSLEYREYDGYGGYRYRQYENGKYSIVRAGKSSGLPSKVQMGVPFDASVNMKAFENIKDEVETAIGPFPGSVPTSSVEIKPGSKSAPKGAPAKEKKGEPEAAAGGGGAGFQSSAADTKETLPPDEDGKDGKDGNWFTQSTMGVPNWGWVAGVVVVGAGAGYYLYSSSKAKAAPPAVK
jgi:hypothetical protein